MEQDLEYKQIIHDIKNMREIDERTMARIRNMSSDQKMQIIAELNLVAQTLIHLIT